MRCMKLASIVTSSSQTVVGGERRFTFNGYINNRGEAYQVLNSIAACFRGMLYFAGGGIVATQDKPGHVVKVSVDQM